MPSFLKTIAEKIINIDKANKVEGIKNLFREIIFGLRKGFSIRKYVVIDMINVIIISDSFSFFQMPGENILEKTKIGKCHIYKPNEIRPIPTKGLLLKILVIISFG